MESELTSTATCETCGNAFNYEPIFILGRDMARPLHRHCDGCQEAADAAIRASRDKERVAELREVVRRTLPPELQPKHLDPLGTDTEHPDFNLPLWKLVRRWRPGPHGNWIGLIGPAGTCKTRILGLLSDMIIMQGNRLTFTSAMRLHAEATNNIRSRERNVSQVAREHIAECMTTPWLIIDDLGNNEWSKEFESQLFTILDHRKNYRLPIGYSSNAHPEQFHQLITSVNPAALIGRLTDRASLFDFTPQNQLPLI